MTFILANWKRIGLALLLAALALAWLRGDHFRAQRDGAREMATAERSGRLADRESYRQAQITAEALAVAQRAFVEAKYREQAKDTDDAYELALVDARSAADAYAARMRVKSPAAAHSQASGPASAPGGATASSPDGPGADADMVAVSRADFDTLNGNTARLIAAREWALGLNK